MIPVDSDALASKMRGDNKKGELMMIMRGIVLRASVLIAAVLVCGCGKAYHGNGWAGFEGFPENNISPQQAVRIAEPYLDETFELRARNRRHVSDREPEVHVMLEGKYYYVVKDNYPSYTPGLYLWHAVKVHKDTGDVSPPSLGKRGVSLQD